MTIEDLGNVGDLIAAIATVATLGYLALQIRQNTKSVQGSTAQAIMEHDVAVAGLVAQHPNIYRRGNASIAELDADERVVYEQIVYVEIAVIWSGFAQYQNGLMGRSELATFDIEWKRNMARPGFRSVWAEERVGFPEDFCHHFDKISAAPEGAV